MATKLRAMAALGIASAIATACTATDDPVTARTDPQTIVEPARVEAMIDGAGIDLGMVSATLPSGLSVKLARPFDRMIRALDVPAPSAVDRCIVQGEWVDEDGDGIPARQLVTYDCEVPSAGGSTTIRGSVWTHDADDQDPTSGYEMQVLGMTVRSIAVNLTRERTFDGRISVATSPSYDGYVVERSLITTYAQEHDVWVSWSTNHGLYKPDVDATNDPWARGTLTGIGRTTVTKLVGESTDTTTWLRETVPTVHYNRACQAAIPFDAGVIRHTDGDGHVLLTVFERCGVALTFDDRAL